MTVPYNLLFLLAFVNIDASPKFRIRFERFVVAEQNPEYFIAKAWTAKVNRTEFGGNLYMNALKRIPPNTIVELKCYEFLNNEYKPFAINLRRPVCEYLVTEYKHFIYHDMPNMMPPKCPLEPGNYTLTNYIIPSHVFPNNLPFNKMLFEIKYIIGEMTLINIQVYAKFDRDIIIREQYS